MCGRFIVAYTYEELLGFLQEGFFIDDVDIDYKPSYNIAPGQPVLSVIKTKEAYKVGYIDWGLIPSFANDKSYQYKMTNARGETIFDKPSFKDSIYNRRALILSNGYYEWERKDGSKQAYLFEREDKEMFAMAAIWSVNKKIDSKPIFTTAIVTKEADSLMEDIHDRMPVILDIKEALQWLDSKISKEDIQEFIQNSRHQNFHKYKVSSYVNKSSNQGIECIKRIED